MASKSHIDSVIGPYKIVRRKGMHRLKLSINHNGEVRVTMPRWAPISEAKQFVASQREWLVLQKPEELEIRDGMVIGRSHTLRISYIESDTIRTRLQSPDAKLFIPNNLTLNDAKVIKKARELSHRALRRETEERIIPRLELLSSTFYSPFRNARVKIMRSRWGSCSSANEITLSCYLAQLPDELVEYVLIHELAHTKVHAHNQKFWGIVEMHDPQYKTHRKQLKSYRPTIALMA